MRTKPALDEIREAISRRRVVSFYHRGEEVRAEPRILGNAMRTNSFVLLAWTLGVDEGWQLFRFAEMSDFNVHCDTIQVNRPPCGKLKRQIVSLDTWAAPVPD